MEDKDWQIDDFLCAVYYRQFVNRRNVLLEFPTHGAVDKLFQEFHELKEIGPMFWKAFYDTKDFLLERSQWLSLADLERMPFNIMTEEGWDFLERGIAEGDALCMQGWMNLKKTVYPPLWRMLAPHVPVDGLIWLICAFFRSKCHLPAERKRRIRKF